MKWIASLFIAGLTAAVAALLHRWPPNNSGEVASWVQGVGSVLAIIASIAIVVWQAKNEKTRARKREALESARTVHAAAKLAVSLSDTAGWLARGDFDLSPRGLAQIACKVGPQVEALGTLNPGQMDSWDATDAALAAIVAARQLLAEVEFLKSDTFNLELATNMFRMRATTLSTELMEQGRLLAREAGAISAYLGD